VNTYRLNRVSEGSDTISAAVTSGESTRTRDDSTLATRFCKPADILLRVKHSKHELVGKFKSNLQDKDYNFDIPQGVYYIHIDITI
jgi:Flp pilus assembly protein TadG